MPPSSEESNTPATVAPPPTLLPFKLVKSQGYFQIGGIDGPHATHTYILTITIEFARNLIKVNIDSDSYSICKFEFEHVFFCFVGLAFGRWVVVVAARSPPRLLFRLRAAGQPSEDAALRRPRLVSDQWRTNARRCACTLRRFFAQQRVACGALLLSSTGPTQTSLTAGRSSSKTTSQTSYSSKQRPQMATTIRKRVLYIHHILVFSSSDSTTTTTTTKMPIRESWLI